MKEILDNLGRKKVEISFSEISQLSKLKGNLIPLINSGHIEYEEYIPIIDDLIRRFNEK